MIRPIFYIKGMLAVAGIVILLAACNLPGRPPATISTAQPVESQTPEGAVTTNTGRPQATDTPTPTPPPLAARVNGFEISLAEYQAELAQYQAAKGTELATEDKQRVLDELIDSALLAQAAEQQGFSADDATLQERMDRLSESLGGQDALQRWISDHRYDDDSFRRALARNVAAAWMGNQIAASVSPLAEQVHVRQILLYDPTTAGDVLSQLKAGNSFDNLAAKYDPVTRGDLGWFPRGYLVDPRVEEAAFALQNPGDTSEVIQSLAGYHILQLLERDPQRQLSPEAWLALQRQAVQQWLKEQRTKATIEVLT